jgi:hypothetical protein
VCRRAQSTPPRSRHTFSTPHVLHVNLLLLQDLHTRFLQQWCQLSEPSSQSHQSWSAVPRTGSRVHRSRHSDSLILLHGRLNRLAVLLNVLSACITAGQGRFGGFALFSWEEARPSSVTTSRPRWAHSVLRSFLVLWRHSELRTTTAPSSPSVPLPRGLDNVPPRQAKVHTNRGRLGRRLPASHDLYHDETNSHWGTLTWNPCSSEHSPPVPWACATEGKPGRNR